MEKTIKIQRWAIFILLFVIGLCGWAIIILGRFLYVQTLNQISALPPTPLPTSTQAPPPARSPTSQFKQVIYSVDTFIDENNNGVWDDNENVYLVDFPLTIIMYDPQYPIQAITAETSDGVDQIRIVRNYLVDQVIEPYTILPENYVGPTYTEDNVYLCPDKEAHSQWESTQETVDANGDVIITIHDLFPLPICPPESPTG